MLILDWLPRTELKTEFAKPIQFNQNEPSRSASTCRALRRQRDG